MKINLLREFKKLAAIGRHVSMRDLVEAARYGHRDRSDATEIAGTYPGWPTCACTCCGCEEPATCTDDGGNPCCEACAEYTTTDAGDVICSRDERTETVTESCGAGNQTHSYVRIKPPQMPAEDAAGKYCLYWDTVGNDARVVTRYATREDAEQAVAAKDWPRPGDHTDYLCGYSVRQLVDGEWLPLGG